MKILKSPFRIIRISLTLIALMIWFVDVADILSFPDKAIRILAYIFIGACMGSFIYMIEKNIKRTKFKESCLCFEGRVISVNEGKTINGTSETVYMGLNDFSYIKNLKSDELNRIFKIKVYVAKDDVNNYIAEVYKKI